MNIFAKAYLCIENIVPSRITWNKTLLIDLLSHAHCLSTSIEKVGSWRSSKFDYCGHITYAGTWKIFYSNLHIINVIVTCIFTMHMPNLLFSTCLICHKNNIHILASKTSINIHCVRLWELGRELARTSRDLFRASSSGEVRSGRKWSSPSSAPASSPGRQPCFWKCSALPQQQRASPLFLPDFVQRGRLRPLCSRIPSPVSIWGLSWRRAPSVLSRWRATAADSRFSCRTSSRS